MDWIPNEEEVEDDLDGIHALAVVLDLLGLLGRDVLLQRGEQRARALQRDVRDQVDAVPENATMGNKLPISP